MTPPPPSAVPQFGDIGIYIVRRLLALVVDVAGVALLIAIALLALFARINANIHPESLEGYRTFVIVVLVALFIYYWLFEGLGSTTLGKLLFGLGVTRDDGSRVGVGRAFVRNLIRFIDVVIIGFVLAAVTKRRKRLGDMFAGSIVVSHRMGALAPIIAIVVLGGAGYLAYAFGDGVAHARALINSSQQYAPYLLGPVTTPAPSAPTAQPVSSATPAASPEATATPTAAATPSAAPGAQTSPITPPPVPVTTAAPTPTQ